MSSAWTAARCRRTPRLVTASRRGGPRSRGGWCPAVSGARFGPDDRGLAADAVDHAAVGHSSGDGGACRPEPGRLGWNGVRFETRAMPRCRSSSSGAARIPGRSPPSASTLAAVITRSGLPPTRTHMSIRDSWPAALPHQRRRRPAATASPRRSSSSGTRSARPASRLGPSPRSATERSDAGRRQRTCRRCANRALHRAFRPWRRGR